MLKLLLGVFRPEKGQLCLRCNGENVHLERSIRRIFACFPQGNLLLSGTLRENLTIVNPTATDEEIQRAIYVSAMDEYLPNLPKGLDTLLGESGAGLSEGQAQRLAIARAVLGGAPILLLDECTSALDEETEKRYCRDCVRFRTVPVLRLPIVLPQSNCAIGGWNYRTERSAPFVQNKEKSRQQAGFQSVEKAQLCWAFSVICGIMF